MPRKPKTRRHLAYGKWVYTEYGKTGQQVGIRFLVNTGKTYANEEMGTNRRKRFSGIKALHATMRLVGSLKG